MLKKKEKKTIENRVNYREYLSLCISLALPLCLSLSRLLIISFNVGYHCRFLCSQKQKSFFFLKNFLVASAVVTKVWSKYNNRTQRGGVLLYRHIKHSERVNHRSKVRGFGVLFRCVYCMRVCVCVYNCNRNKKVLE